MLCFFVWFSTNQVRTKKTEQDEKAKIIFNLLNSVILNTAIVSNFLSKILQPPLA